MLPVTIADTEIPLRLPPDVFHRLALFEGYVNADPLDKAAMLGAALGLAWDTPARDRPRTRLGASLRVYGEAVLRELAQRWRHVPGVELQIRTAADFALGQILESMVPPPEEEEGNATAAAPSTPNPTQESRAAGSSPNSPSPADSASPAPAAPSGSST